jgi:hypothetical protein
MAGEATFLLQTAYAAGRLDQGMIGVLEAGGGSEFGYSYTYALSGAPAGITVDGQSGVLLSNGLVPAGVYGFSAVVTNFKDPSKVATLPVTLTLLRDPADPPPPAVTRKVYSVNSGTYGTPGAGGDYTAVLFAIRSQILTDQAAAGDERFRAIVEFDPAVSLYGCTDNRWTYGIQYLEMRSSVPGTRVNYKNIRTPGTPANMSASVLQIGRGFMTNCQETGSFIGDANKLNAYRINTASKGATSVTLQTAAEASNITPHIGRYVMIGSYDQQGEGFPANIRYFDYARVVGVSGATVTLDRRLRYTHKADYWENAASTNSWGPARIKLIDRNDQRLTQRARVVDITFLENTALPRQDLYVYAFEAEFINCNIRRYIPSQARYHRFESCNLDSGEFDKLLCAVFMKNVTCDASYGGLYQATGLEFLLYDTCTMTSGSGIVPRQWRLVGGTQAGVNDYALEFSSLSQVRQAIAKGVTFSGPKTPLVYEWPNETVTVGTNSVAWNGTTGRLTVPVIGTTGDATYNSARRFAAQVHEGSILHAGGETSSRYGYVTSITGDASNLYFDVVWLAGAQPASGDVLEVPKEHELILDNACTATNGMVFNGASASHQVIPGITARDFPAGYPASTYGF